MPWVEKFRPTSFSEIKGQEEAVQKAKIFISTFGKKKKAIILHGPPGTGKTTIAGVIAKATDSEIFELNASDLRNKLKLNEVLRPAIEQRSLLKERKIILVDEVDGISATDRGGLQELISLLDNSQFPMIITANNIWNKKLNNLRKKAELIELKEIKPEVVQEVLSEVLKKKNLSMNNEILAKIAEKSKGDLRAAINDLQTTSELKDQDNIEFDERNKETDIFNALKSIFKEKPSNELLGKYDSVKMQLDEIMLWVEENIPLEYSGEELEKAYDALSKADVFKGRIYKQQHWRFLIYENILLSYGISASKKGEKIGFTSYKKPSRILKIWMNNMRTMKKKSIAKKYARLVHVGEKRAMNEFPIIKQIIKSNTQIQKELKLDEDELAYIYKTN